MERTTVNQQVWIYIDESDRRHGQPLSNLILELLRRHGCPGATVLRGVAGYGSHNVLHTTMAVDVPSHLPLIITLVDRAERLAKVLPELSELVQEGLITVTPVEVVKATARAGGPFPRHMTVADVMTREVVQIAPGTPIHTIVGLLIDRAVRSLPVVDPSGRVLGILTDGDLLRRGATGLAVALQRELPPGERAIDTTPDEAPLCAADLMTPDPLVLPMTTTLAQAATVMVEQNLKRIPVVDAAGRLRGMVSRHDLLATVAEGLHERPSEPLQLPAGAPTTVGGLMLTEVPTVHRDTPLAEAIERVLDAAQRRVVVVDERGRVAGIITDGDVLRRAARRLPGGALRRLAGWLTGGERPKELEIEARGRTAAEVMTSPVITVGAGTPVAEAIRLMMAHGVKRLPVIDPDGTLVGLVGRAGLLIALSARSR